MPQQYSDGIHNFRNRKKLVTAENPLVVTKPKNLLLPGLRNISVSERFFDQKFNILPRGRFFAKAGAQNTIHDQRKP